MQHILRMHWTLVVMDEFTRRISDLAFAAESVDGPSLCSMLQRAIQGQTLPKYLSTDNDPLYRFHEWQANLRMLEVMAIDGFGPRSAASGRAGPMSS